MRNCDNWKPSKFVYRKGRLIASRDPNEVAISSRLGADMVAKFYDDHLQMHAKGKLLDLGCGNVPFFAAYRDLVTTNICVDWQNTLHPNEYLDYECNLAETLPFKDREFDTIILSDVLEHIPQPDCLWREMARILASRGKIIMNVPFFYCLHEQPHDYYRYTRFALQRFVEMSGLKLIQLDSAGGVPEIMTDLFAKMACQLPVIGNTSASFAQWFTAAFTRTRIGRKLSDRTKDRFPLGYCLIAEKVD